MRHFDPWALMRHVFCKLFCPCDHRKRPTVRVGFKFGAFSVSFVGKEFSMLLPDDKQVAASVSYKDVKGNPAQLCLLPDTRHQSLPAVEHVRLGLNRA